MSSFKSSQTLSQTESSVNKLLAKYLPGAAQISSTTSTSSSNNLGRLTSGAAKINKLGQDLTKLRSNKHSMTKLKLKEKKLKNEAIKKNQIIADKVNKLSRLQTGDVTETKKLVEKNLKNLKSWESQNAADLQKLQTKILRMKNNENGKRKRVRQSKVKKQEFNAKIKKGHIAVAGLTPGLAPVGDDDSDEDDSDVESSDNEGNDGGFDGVDDYDDYN